MADSMEPPPLFENIDIKSSPEDEDDVFASAIQVIAAISDFLPFSPTRLSSIFFRYENIFITVIVIVCGFSLIAYLPMINTNLWFLVKGTSTYFIIGGRRYAGINKRRYGLFVEIEDFRSETRIGERSYK